MTMGSDDEGANPQKLRLSFDDAELLPTPNPERMKLCFDAARLLQQASEFAVARTCYQKAANLGLCEAQRALAYMQLRGEGGPMKPAEAQKWLFEAGKRGDRDAQNDLIAILIQKGENAAADIDIEAVVAWLVERARQDDRDAQSFLVDIYTSGRANSGISQDDTKAQKWKHFIGAHSGNPIDQHMLGLVYLFGDTTLEIKPDLKKAFRWFELAANQEHKEAQYEMGRCSLKGWGVECCPKEACRHFKPRSRSGAYGCSICLGAVSPDWAWCRKRHR